MGTISKKDQKKLKEWLDHWTDRFNRPEFIETDPIGIPKRFEKKQDKEIAGFFAATFAWGQRTTIIQKTNELMNLMDNAPYDFIRHHSESDLSRFLSFKHRTFQATDTLYFLAFLQQYYREQPTLENAFLLPDGSFEAGASLEQFHRLFFSLPYAPERTRKHVATPERKSTCKRMNMYLRWMCRRDNRGVDLGIWQHIPMNKLMIPLDVHVERTARNLGLLTRKQRDWQAVEEVTENLRLLDTEDPVKYDFALFGLSILQPKIVDSLNRY